LSFSSMRKDSDLLVSIWWFDFGMVTFVDECIIIINLGEL
jgi:hypothetical protein